MSAPQPGDALPPLRIASVSPDSMKAWAVFLRDPNPLHLDPAAVKARGLGDRVINQGPANLAYVINMLSVAFPGAPIEALNARYVDNVYGGDAVEAGGLVQKFEDGRVHVDIWLNVDGRGAAITGTAVIAVDA